VCWADLPAPVGSAPGYRRPVVAIQGDAFNRSGLSTLVCVTLTRNLARARLPGNVLLAARRTGLQRDSVANVTQIMTLDRSQLGDPVGHLSRGEIDLILAGIDIVLGR
jgi:mRNA interferase MazF